MTIWFWVSAYVSEVIGTSVGFGSSTVFQPMALLFVDFKSALVLVAFFHIFGTLSRLVQYRRELEIKLLVKFGVPSILLTLVGAWLVGSLPQELLKGVLGGFLIGLGLFSLTKKRLKLKRSDVNLGIGGAVSGFLTGLIGTGGALRGAFLTAFELPKERYIATAAVIALTNDLTRIPVYLSRGYLNPENFKLLPGLLLIAILGSLSGKQLIKKIPQAIFVKLVMAAVMAAGGYLVYGWIKNF